MPLTALVELMGDSWCASRHLDKWHPSANAGLGLEGLYERTVSCFYSLLSLSDSLSFINSLPAHQRTFHYTIHSVSQELLKSSNYSMGDNITNKNTPYMVKQQVISLFHTMSSLYHHWLDTNLHVHFSCILYQMFWGKVINTRYFYMMQKLHWGLKKDQNIYIYFFLTMCLILMCVETSRDI